MPCIRQPHKSFYAIEAGDAGIEECRDELKPVHREVLALLNVDQERYWAGKEPEKNHR
ncbi:MAG: hypothetical protein V1929_05960 [bacterium]